MTRIISIGTDRNVSKEGSEARSRQSEYGRLFEELHLLVFSLRKHGLKREQVASNVWVYPTNSLSRFFYIADAQKIGKEILKKEGTWTITSQDPFETGLAAYALSQYAHAPFIPQIHTNLFNSFFSKFSLLNKIRIRIARRLLPKAHAIRVVSPEIKNHLVHDRKFNIPDSRIHVLPMFIDIAKFASLSPQFILREKYPEFDTFVLVVARLEREKNVSLALHVAEKVVKKFPRTGFVIVGEGSERRKLERLAEELRITANVKFEGWQTDLASYYKSATLLLNTSFFEGFSRSLIEAAGAGCPIISTPVSPLGGMLVAGKDAVVCKIGDTDCFFKEIEKLIEDKTLRDSLSRNAKDAVSALSSKEEYVSAYRQIFTR